MGAEAPAKLQLDGRGRRIGIVVSRFNAAITESLLAAARRTLSDAGVGSGDVTVVTVPGAFEIPIAAERLLRKAGVDGVLALGAVIRGDTPHFDYVCRAVTDGCLRVALDARKPVCFGVLTCDTLAQAQARSGAGDDNKGAECARALLETLHALEALG